MTEEQLVRSAVGVMLGNAKDNAHRARRAFYGADMTKQHGESGRTRAEILRGYEEHEYDCQRAMEWFENLVKESK